VEMPARKKNGNTNVYENKELEASIKREKM
jgi:hypothetical protein